MRSEDAADAPTGFGDDGRAGGRSIAPGSDQATAFGDRAIPNPDEDDTDAITVLPRSDPADAITGLSETPPVGADPHDTGPLVVGQNFGTRYHIIRLLGIGGMGAVYQAWDAELGVAVAIKVIRPEVMANPTAAAEVERRFKRELLLARQVTHKNVVRIHDIGEIGGIKYITMSYVDGVDLATLIKQKGGLDVATVLRVARSVVSGLSAAHAAGVVHRDLKPANIMIGSDGEALIMDFGIARSTGSAEKETGFAPAEMPAGMTRSATSLVEATMYGAVVGTVEYMAPEQAKGEPVDQRADVYSFGLILYDALVGRRRSAAAENVVAELQARMKSAPAPVRSVVPGVPEAFDAVISRCLEPDRARRYESTVQLAAALDLLDENGEPIPIRRVVGMPLLAAVVVLLLGLSVGTWWYSRQAVPAAPHDPVSVLISDFRNDTGDSSFDHALEPTLRMALEGAGFISAHDRSVIARIGVAAPETLDEVAAGEIAVRQGLGVVLSGALERRGRDYVVSVKAMQAVTGDVIVTAQERTSDKQQVAAAVTRLASHVRKALGDDTSDSAQRFAMETLSATSLEVVRYYAAAMEAVSNNRSDEARESFSRAVELDPSFGLAYAGMAMMSRNMLQQQDAEKYAKESLRHVDRMTERERYRTRGIFYYVTGDYQQCVKEYSDLIERYAADVTAHNNLALCSTYLRDMPTALAEMQRVVEILPNRALYRVNLSLYASYAGDFQVGEREALRAQELGRTAKGPVALAFANIGLGQFEAAAESYRQLALVDELGASRATSGLADLAMYEGRFADGVRILREGIEADLAAQNSDRAAAKLAALAYAELLRGQPRSAVAAGASALEHSNAVNIRFLVGRVFAEVGDLRRARTVSASLASEFQIDPQVYAKIIEGVAALKEKDARRAVTLLTEANATLDTWIGRFDLGRAYLEAGAFPQADSEFDRCLKRRGEALSLFLDEEPTYAYLPHVYYFQGRVRQGMNSVAFADSYKTYLGIRDKAGEDPLLPEVRKRAAG